MLNTGTGEVSTGKLSAFAMAVARDTLPGDMSTLRLTIREVAEKEGITNPKELSERTGLYYESCRLMWNGTSRRVDLDSLKAICDALNVGPAQLFEYRRDDPLTDEPKGKRKG
jgi:DNA-binding Xre family transcriptional regulator